MSTSSKKGTILSCLTIMAMTMEALSVFHIIGSARDGGHVVVVFPDILRCKDESTASAFALLFLEQYCYPLWNFSVCARRSCTAWPVAIADTFGASYFA